MIQIFPQLTKIPVPMKNIAVIGFVAYNILMNGIPEY